MLRIKLNKAWGRAAIVTGVILFGAAFSLLSCSNRPRSNPFDPHNPDPSLRTAGFNALAGNGEVLLHWDPINYVDVVGLQIERFSLGNRDTMVLNDSLLPVSALVFHDPNVENGTTYSYRLRLALKESAERPATESDLATPGGIYPWISSYDRTEVTRVTPDFRDERYNMEVSFGFVADMQVKPDNSEIWVLDNSAAKIVRFYTDGSYVPDQGSLGQTSAFRFNPFDRSLWIASYAQNSTVYHLTRNGTVDASYNTDVLPTWIALDIPGSGAWIGTSEKKIVYIKNGIVTNISDPAFISPEKIVSGAGSSAAWALDYDAKAVFHLSGSNVDWNMHIFSNPQDIAVNNDNTVCWVADMDADIVYLVDNHQDIIAQAKSLGRPTDLTYNQFDGTVFVTGADGSVSNITSDGTVLWKTKLPNSPGQILIQ